MNQNEKESPKILGEEEYEKAISLVNSGNRKESIPLFYKSASLRYPPSFLWLYELSLYIHYSEIENFETKAASNFNWYQSKAQDGKSDSLYNLGICYQKGIGTKKDLEKAAELYTKAAEQGHTEAQYNLGFFYKYGEGVPRDIKRAVEWLTKAAKQGHFFAQSLYLDSDIEVQVVADIIKENSTFTRIGLRENEIGDSEARIIAEALKIHTTLTELDLAGNKIGDLGVNAIAEALKIDRVPIKEIELKKASIIDIEQSLKIKKVLLKLDLSDNQIGDEGIDSIAEMLKINNSLQELDILDNSFNDISKLGEALKYNKSLISLKIEESKDSIKILKQALKSNISLLRIYRKSGKLFKSPKMDVLRWRNQGIQITLSERIFKCKNTHLSLLDYKILERVNVAVIFNNIWKLHQIQQTGKLYEECLREYWELMIGFSKNFLFILGVCKLNQIPPSRSHLLGIPREILNYIGSFLNPQDFSTHCENCKLLKKQLARSQAEVQELKKQLTAIERQKDIEESDQRRKRKKRVV